MITMLRYGLMPAAAGRIVLAPGRIRSLGAMKWGPSWLRQLPMNFRSYVYLAIRRSEPAAQDLVGIIRTVGQEIGVYSEADLDKLPTHAELSDSLRDLIKSGRIAEVSPHRYREATYGSVGETSREFRPPNMRRRAQDYFLRLFSKRAAGSSMPRNGRAPIAHGGGSTAITFRRVLTGGTPACCIRSLRFVLDGMSVSSPC